MQYKCVAVVYGCALKVRCTHLGRSAIKYYSEYNTSLKVDRISVILYKNHNTLCRFM